MQQIWEKGLRKVDVHGTIGALLRELVMVEVDEIAGFLCGQADDETRSRVVDELNDPGSEFNRRLQDHGEFPPSPLDVALERSQVSEAVRKSLSSKVAER